ncbi:PREDICTED: protein DGS1, mitochondrial-like isoform X2 [Nicotiana attenuata]|uniref:Protein dgs1, mitochondrial n=1 Tax=Nicotiana attenuata TaxID=49451 RepID=A0A1J6KVB8_NICAT|nr:PREDICTED: protein DGS1, mitochondrial-like isoform X2 [Nicotiana attenuata]OIT23017.1 protein dgs1, mitochondrial [Nicotiana attenuata]
MDSPPENDAAKSLKPVASFYSDYLWNRMRSLLPAAFSSNFLSRISNLYRGGSNTRSRKRRPRNTCLPLPLPSPSTSPESSVVVSEASRIFDVLEDIMEHIFLNLHYIQKNLEFWQSKAEGSNAQKAYFMVCERGPSAFINGIVQLIHDYVGDGSVVQHSYCMASSYISERINVLISLRYHLATFLAQVYMEVDKAGNELVKDPEKSLSSLLVAINELFLKLEASIGHFHAMRQKSSVDESYSFPLILEKLPVVNQEGSRWTDCEIKDAINLIYQNLDKLDSYLSAIVFIHRKPRRVARYWMRYTFGIVGISVCSLWLLRHSSFAGSSDIDNWIHEAKKSTVSFWNDHVEQPLLSIRNDLFDTFRKRQKGAMEPEEVQLTADSLHRMLRAFTEQSKGEKPLQNATDQKMLEIVMARYEKELMHPIQNLFSGELARALLIQVQKLKLDIEEAMLELDQILRANEINFAILAALPAFFLSLIVIMVMRAWIKQDTRAEGRGRVARIQRRLLIVEVERKIMQLERCKYQGREKDAQCMYGLALYSLDRLYCAVEGHARETGEWISLRQDIIDLAKPDTQTAHKLKITSRMERVYDCLLPLPKSR